MNFPDLTNQEFGVSVGDRFKGNRAAQPNRFMDMRLLMRQLLQIYNSRRVSTKSARFGVADAIALPTTYAASN